MPSISGFRFSIFTHPQLSSPRLFSPTNPSIFRKITPRTHCYSSESISRRTLFRRRSSEEEAGVAEAEDEWLQKLPEKKKPLYSHSLPCVEAWLRSVGFYQSRDDRAVWFIEKPDWHAQLSLDVTDLYIRFVLALLYIFYLPRSFSAE